MTEKFDNSFYEQLSLSMDSMPTTISKYAKYSCMTPGKLLRPRFLVSIASALGLTTDNLELIIASSAVEQGHIASLVHDDIIDGSPMRRGNESVHSKFGVPIGIITGDSLIFSMFHQLSKIEDKTKAAAAIEAISHMGMELCAGESMEDDLSFVSDTADFCTYIKLVHYKTASYFVAMSKVAVALASSSDDITEELANICLLFGIAFQIRDDLLPMIETSSAAGKPLELDRENNLVTAIDFLRSGMDIYSVVIDYVDNYFCRDSDDKTTLEKHLSAGEEAYSPAELMERFRVEICHRIDLLPKSFGVDGWEPLKKLVLEAL